MEDRVSLWGWVRKSRDADGQGMLTRGSHSHGGGGPPSPKDPTVLAPAASHFTTLGPCDICWQNQNFLSILLAILQERGRKAGQSGFIAGDLGPTARVLGRGDGSIALVDLKS